MKLSIIVPCKNEEGNITELYEKINETLDKLYVFEIIYKKSTHFSLYRL